MPPLARSRAGVDALDPASVEGAVAVASPGTFDRAFEGVFADLEARASSWRPCRSQRPPMTREGAPLEDLAGADVHLAVDLDDGSVGVWTVAADDLARVRASPSTLLRRPTTPW